MFFKTFETYSNLIEPIVYTKLLVAETVLKMMHERDVIQAGFLESWRDK